MSIRWNEIEPERYEDMVSVLVSRLHPDAQRIDGKGGDGGRDAQIVREPDNQITDAFELKSFTGRMTSGRRKQVTRSLKRASALGPARWSLVVPIDPTPGEERWFRQLGENYCFPITWFGRTWLDEKMSMFPDIRRYFVEGAKDEVYRLLLELRKEQARVTDVRDAIGRLRTLHERLNEIDPHYRYEISTGKEAADSRPTDVVLSASFGDARVDLYPKYAGACEDRPITISVMVAIEPGEEVIQDALNYGQELTIPPRMVSSITIDAPAGLGGSFIAGEIHISPIDTRLVEPVTLALSIMDGDRLLAVCPVHLTEHTRGLRGSVVTGNDSTGCLQPRLQVDIAAQELKAEFSLNLKRAMPAALVPLFRWLGSFRPPNSLTIRWPSGPETRIEIRTPFLMDGRLGKVVEALAYLQDHSGIHWEMTPSLTPKEGHEIVTAATLLKGESIDFRWESFNLSLNSWGPALRELVDGIPSSFLCEQDTWLDMEGVRIPIGRIRTHIKTARLANPEDVKQALTSGLVAHLRLVPGDSDQAQRVLVS